MAMENDALFNYIKLAVDNAWILFIAAAALLVWRNPSVLNRLSKVVVGSITVELRDLQQQVDFLKERNAQLGQVIDGLDANAPKAAMSKPRGQLKAIAGRLQSADMERVTAGLKPGASAEEIYAAAEIARARRDPAMFDDLVACLSRLGNDDELLGVRLQTVWTLTSAVHRTLIADFEHATTPTLTVQQLETAAGVLERLVRNPRVLEDRPDDPSKGVRGPAKNAASWIEKGLKILRAQPVR